mgnify:FL=1
MVVRVRVGSRNAKNAATSVAMTNSVPMLAGLRGARCAGTPEVRISNFQWSARIVEIIEILNGLSRRRRQSMWPQSRFDDGESCDWN